MHHGLGHRRFSTGSRVVGRAAFKAPRVRTKVLPAHPLRPDHQHPYQPQHGHQTDVITSEQRSLLRGLLHGLRQRDLGAPTSPQRCHQAKPNRPDVLPSATAVAASQGDAAMPMARPVTRQRMPTKRGGLVSRCWMIMRLAVKNAPPSSAIRARPPQQSGEVVAGRAHQCTGYRHHGSPLHEALPAHPLDPPALLRDGQNGEAGIHRRDQAEFLGAHRHLAHERCSGKSSHARLHKLGEPQDENRGVKQPIRCGSGRVGSWWRGCGVAGALGGTGGTGARLARQRGILRNASAKWFQVLMVVTSKVRSTISLGVKWGRMPSYMASGTCVSATSVTAFVQASAARSLAVTEKRGVAPGRQGGQPACWLACFQRVGEMHVQAKVWHCWRNAWACA